jgi:hypothetical protein
VSALVCGAGAHFSNAGNEPNTDPSLNRLIVGASTANSPRSFAGGYLSLLQVRFNPGTLLDRI